MTFLTATLNEHHILKLFLAATLEYWLSAFVFPNNEGSEIQAETFPMACQMARGIRTAVGVSCLSSMYTRLDTLTDKKRSPQDKKGELQIYYILGWLATYYPKSYN